MKPSISVLVALHGDGTFECADGTTGRLAGIEMRPASETDEPHGLDHALQIVRASDKNVRIQFAPDGKSAVVSYGHPIQYRDVANITGLKYLMPQRYDTSLNALLVYLGLAILKPEDDMLSPTIKNSIVESQHEYICAVHRGYYHRPLEACARDPRMLCVKTGLFANISSGDWMHRESQAWRRDFDKRILPRLQRCEKAVPTSMPWNE